MKIVRRISWKKCLATLVVCGLGVVAASLLTPTKLVRQLPAAEAKKSPGPIRDITFDHLKFEMNKEDPFERKMLTDKIEKLNDSRIRIRGYMRPSFQESGITKFILVRDNMECCFGPGAYLYDCIIVDLQEGQSIDYTIRPVSVEGTFSLKELLGPGKRHLAIYHLSGEKVK